jgi:nucleoporin NDC1
VIYYSRDILAFPSIQRHRYFRIKQQLPSTLPHAAFLALSGYILGSLFSILAGRGAPSLGAAFPVISVSALCTLCWLVGTIAFEVVFTERLRPDDYGTKECLRAMEVCLEGRNGVVMQDLALFDLSLVATDAGKASWRREEIFADDSGGRWRPLATHCMGILNQIADSMAVALPKKAAAGTTAGAKKAASGAASWNVVPSALVKGMPIAQRQNLDAVSVVSCSYQRGKLALRSLCDMAVASLTQDRFGVVQLVQPTLGDIVLQLLCMILSTQQLLKQIGPNSVSGASNSSQQQPWRGTGDAPYSQSDAVAALHAFHDELNTGMYHITGAFGPALKEALVKATVVPPFGSTVDAGKLLDKFFSGTQ